MQPATNDIHSTGSHTTETQSAAPAPGKTALPESSSVSPAPGESRLAETSHGDSLPVMEAFYTLQGEGFHQGKAAYFIRLGGCDVGCVWCDVKDSWEADRHPRLSVRDIVAGACAHPGRLAVITGGEPLMHDCSALTDQLYLAGFATHIETSGAWPLTGEWDWICLSPKKFKEPLPGILPLANELKVVIFNKSDFEWAEQYAARVPAGCKLYLQPEWSKSGAMTPLIVEYIKENPRWEFSLQLHKYIQVP